MDRAPRQRGLSHLVWRRSETFRGRTASRALTPPGPSSADLDFRRATYANPIVLTIGNSGCGQISGLPAAARRRRPGLARAAMSTMARSTSSASRTIRRSGAGQSWLSTRNPAQKPVSMRARTSAAVLRPSGVSGRVTVARRMHSFAGHCRLVPASNLVTPQAIHGWLGACAYSSRSLLSHRLCSC